MSTAWKGHANKLRLYWGTRCANLPGCLCEKSISLLSCLNLGCSDWLYYFNSKAGVGLKTSYGRASPRCSQLALAIHLVLSGVTSSLSTIEANTQPGGDELTALRVSKTCGPESIDTTTHTTLDCCQGCPGAKCTWTLTLTLKHGVHYGKIQIPKHQSSSDQGGHRNLRSRCHWPCDLEVSQQNAGDHNGGALQHDWLY